MEFSENIIFDGTRTSHIYPMLTHPDCFKRSFQKGIFIITIISKLKLLPWQQSKASFIDIWGGRKNYTSYTIFQISCIPSLGKRKVPSLERTLHFVPNHQNNKISNFFMSFKIKRTKIPLSVKDKESSSCKVLSTTMSSRSAPEENTKT